MTVDQILNLQKKQLASAIQKGGVAAISKLYDEVRVDIEKKLSSLVARGEGTTFTAQHMRVVLAQVNAGIAQLNKQMVSTLGKHGKTVGSLGNKQVIASAKALEKHFTGHTPVLRVEQAAATMSTMKAVAPALLNRYKKSEQYYTKPVVQKIKQQLAKSLISGESLSDAVDRVAGTDGVFAKEKWRAERIARTELAYTAGIVKQQTMEDLTKLDMPDMQKKLIATFDNRTGDDSKELHGQIQDVNKPFLWEVKDSKGRKTGKVVKYMQPPNRSNDRECVIPWRPSWKETALTRPRSV